jgi:hypothetical protein
MVAMLQVCGEFSSCHSKLLINATALNPRRQRMTAPFALLALLVSDPVPNSMQFSTFHHPHAERLCSDYLLAVTKQVFQGKTRHLRALQYYE